MTKFLDMQLMRYMNLFRRVTGVSAIHCFIYNNMIVFVTPRVMLDRAIGMANSNLKKLSDILGRRIRVVWQPRAMADLEKFVSVIVSPVRFKKIEVVASETGPEAVIISDGMESKAMLIGKKRIREQELKEVLSQYFEIKNLKIL